MFVIVIPSSHVVSHKAVFNTHLIIIRGIWAAMLNLEQFLIFDLIRELILHDNLRMTIGNFLHQGPWKSGTLFSQTKAGTRVQ